MQQAFPSDCGSSGGISRDEGEAADEDDTTTIASVSVLEESQVDAAEVAAGKVMAAIHQGTQGQEDPPRFWEKVQQQAARRRYKSEDTIMRGVNGQLQAVMV